MKEIPGVISLSPNPPKLAPDDGVPGRPTAPASSSSNSSRNQAVAAATGLWHGGISGCPGHPETFQPDPRNVPREMKTETVKKCENS